MKLNLDTSFSEYNTLESEKREISSLIRKNSK